MNFFSSVTLYASPSDFVKKMSHAALLMTHLFYKICWPYILVYLLLKKFILTLRHPTLFILIPYTIIVSVIAPLPFVRFLRRVWFP